ncbi:MAG: hypothetical protein K2X66_06275 [Cyanobacteria bacterium]|nr:hypothetical protein [Cyanobacteriota bacterium]
MAYPCLNFFKAVAKQWLKIQGSLQGSNVSRRPLSNVETSNFQKPGTTMPLVMFLLTMMILNISIFGLMLSRGLGDEGFLLSYNIPAKRGLETAFTRLTSSVNTYLQQSDTSALTTDYAQAGPQAITNAVIQATNPETSATDNTPTTISAWISATRGNYYQVTANSTVSDVSLTASRWYLMKPCSPNGTVKTITNGMIFTAPSGVATNRFVKTHANSGRVFFGTTNSFMTWHPSTGLSTLLTGLSNPGRDAIEIENSTGRVYFGDASGFYTWLDGTLSTIATGLTTPGRLSTTVDQTTGRVFFGDDTKFYTWQSSTGLSTIASGQINPGQALTAISPTSGRVFFASNNYTSGPNTLTTLMTWTPASGLQTIFYNNVVTSSLTQTIIQNSLVADPSNNQILFKVTSTPDSTTRFYTWNAKGLQKIATYGGLDSTTNSAGAFDPISGRAFYSVATNAVYTWLNGTLEKVAIGGTYTSMLVDQGSGRLFFGDLSSGKYHTWLNGTLSTLITGVSNPGANDAQTVDSKTGRVFFGDAANYYTWLSATGLSTILASSTTPGVNNSSVVDSSTGRVFFGAGTNYYSWTANTGLSTLTTGISSPGVNSTTLDPSTGTVFYTSNTAPKNLYSYTSPEYCRLN